MEMFHPGCAGATVITKKDLCLTSITSFSCHKKFFVMSSSPGPCLSQRSIIQSLIWNAALLVHQKKQSTLVLPSGHMTQRFITNHCCVNLILPNTKTNKKYFLLTHSQCGGSETARQLKENASLCFCMQ